MGSAAALDQSEDCLELTIFVPETAPDRPLPVMVWLHGGAYLTGSGGWNLYDASELAARGPMVVVAVTYRLGILGYLDSPGLSEGNMGLSDQIAALEWVQRHIAVFGGDPAEVTVAGQSAGAQSIIAMLGIESTRPLFQRAIVQSAPLGLGFHSRDDAARAAAQVLANSDADPRTLPIDALLSVQDRTAEMLAGSGILRAAPPFQPVWGASPLPEEEEWKDAVERRIRDVDLMIGSTTDEASAFLPNPHPAGSEDAATTGRVQQMMTNTIFAQPATEFADRWAQGGGNAHLYAMAPITGTGPLGACHCYELPLLFGSPEDWSGAPMMQGIPAASLSDARASLQSRWAGFVRDGDPSWSGHTAGASAHEL